mmetsp:Transcript_20058/g.60029  ORF Transcript_20058/g.60029 Transcript_20058/m.60029 type:complete len:246 (-) Transcript_20058:1416-2153(-)
MTGGTSCGKSFRISWRPSTATRWISALPGPSSPSSSSTFFTMDTSTIWATRRRRSPTRTRIPARLMTSCGKRYSRRGWKPATWRRWRPSYRRRWVVCPHWTNSRGGTQTTRSTRRPRRSPTMQRRRKLSRSSMTASWTSSRSQTKSPGRETSCSSSKTRGCHTGRITRRPCAMITAAWCGPRKRTSCGFSLVRSAGKLTGNGCCSITTRPASSSRRSRGRSSAMPRTARPWSAIESWSCSARWRS